MRQIPVNSSSVNRAPVGLFGLQIRISRVRAVTSVASSSRSGLQRGVAASGVADERPGDDAGAERARQAAHLHVVRRHHHHVVARLDKVQERNAVGLGAAVRHLDVIGRGAAIDFGDRAPQRERAVRLRIAQRLREQRVALVVRFSHFLDAKRMHAALGDVPGHAVLPGGLEPLHRKRFELHFGEFIVKRQRRRRSARSSHGATESTKAKRRRRAGSRRA